MDKSPALSVLFLFFIFIAVISLSRGDSIITVREGEVVKLEFPYPCDSSKLTIQNANSAPFYNSDEPSLNLKDNQINRFSVEVKNCSHLVEINPVMRYDEATYICRSYKHDKGGVIVELIRVRLNVDYPPGKVSCIPSGNVNVRVGEWVILKCEMPVSSLALEIILCYQDAKRLPPRNQPVQTDEILKQTIWATEEHPVFCCSFIPGQPTDICECNDFSWDPSYIKNVSDPCPSTTPRLLTTTNDQIGESSTEHPFPKIFTPVNSTTTPNKVHFSPLLGCLITIIVLLVASLALVILCFWCKVKLSYKDSTKKKDNSTQTRALRSKLRDCTSQIPEKSTFWAEVYNREQKWQRPWNKSYAGFQFTSEENIHDKHIGVYRYEYTRETELKRSRWSLFTVGYSTKD